MEKNRYNSVIKEYKKRAHRYNLSCQRFVSRSQAVAVEELNPTRGERILDAGCGTGLAMASIANSVGENGEVVGIDISKDMLSVAKKDLPENKNIVFINGNLEKIKYPDNYFDAIVSVNVMHYLHDIDAMLSEFYRLLKPKGRMVLIGFCTDYLFFGIIERIWRLVIPSHVRAYSLDELSRKVKTKGFKIVGEERFKFGWFWRSLLLKVIRGEGEALI